jgi:hypothetical protein
MFKVHKNVAKLSDAKVLDYAANALFSVPNDRKDVIIVTNDTVGFSQQDGAVGLLTPAGTVEVVSFSSAALGGTGMALDATFSGSFSYSNAVDGFYVRADDEVFEIDSVDVADDVATINLAKAILPTQTVYLSYFADQGSLYGSLGKAPSFVRQAVDNNSTAAIPELDTAGTDTAGAEIILTFTEAMESGSPVEGFSAIVNGDAAEISGITFDGSDVVLAVAGLTDTDVITASYDSDAGTLRAVATKLLAESFSAESVTNNVT